MFESARGEAPRDPAEDANFERAAFGNSASATIPLRNQRFAGDLSVMAATVGIKTGSGSCFVAGTLVSAVSGLIPVEDLSVGSEVWAFDHITGEWRPCRVEQTFANDYVGTLVEVNLTEEAIESTVTHPYWVVQGEGLESRPRTTHVEIIRPEGATTAGRWVDAQHLCEGDELFLRDGRAVAIRSIKNRQFSGKVYNIKVADLECYAVGVNNVLVHNKAAEPSPVAGLVQGGLNALNGLTNMATDATNLAIKTAPLMAGGGANPLDWLWALTAPKIKKYDWSFGMTAPEDKNLHDWSVFAGGFGLSIFAGEGLGSLWNSISEAGWGMADSAATGAFDPAAANAGGNGLGLLSGREVTVTQEGLDIVSQHLSTFEEFPGEFPQNTMMLERLQSAMNAGERVSGADAVFYTHELVEARLMGAGMAYEDAHAAALSMYNVSPFSVYHPDVINALPELFNSSWRAFWGL
jgi:hypothetical protein